jgi:predicted branched-subunit amino acid permease
LTDETFAVHSARFASGTVDKAEVYVTNMTAQAAWVFGTWLGVIAGRSIADTKLFALDYALPAMFVALLVSQIRNRVQVSVALLTGVLAVGLSLIGIDQWSVILATLAGATAGVVLEQWTKRRSP